jgi:hypothetical protein
MKKLFLKEITEVAPKTYFIDMKIVDRYVREMDHDALWKEFNDVYDVVLDYFFYQNYELTQS